MSNITPRLRCSQDRAAPRKRVIAMPMGDDGAIDRAMRIDEELTGFAIEPAIGRIEPSFGMGKEHRANVGSYGANATVNEISEN